MHTPSTRHLARYRIVIAAMVSSAPQASSSLLTTAAVNGGVRRSHSGSSISSGAMSTASSEKHVARPCSPTPSVGIIAVRLMELEPGKDRWRRVAREWYAKVVAEFPGRGKLHYHLDFSVARQKAMSCVQFTTLFMGEVR